MPGRWPGRGMIEAIVVGRWMTRTLVSLMELPDKILLWDRDRLWMACGFASQSVSVGCLTSDIPLPVVTFKQYPGRREGMPRVLIRATGRYRVQCDPSCDTAIINFQDASECHDQPEITGHLAPHPSKTVPRWSIYNAAVPSSLPSAKVRVAEAALITRYNPPRPPKRIYIKREAPGTIITATLPSAPAVVGDCDLIPLACHRFSFVEHYPY